MIQVVGIVAGLAIVVMLFAGAAALTYTGICILLGFGFGSLVTLMVTYDRFQQQAEREEARREREHQRNMEMILAARSLGQAQVHTPTIDVTSKRLARR